MAIQNTALLADRQSRFLLRCPGKSLNSSVFAGFQLRGVDGERVSQALLQGYIGAAVTYGIA